MEDETFYVWVIYPSGLTQMEAGPFSTRDSAKVRASELMDQKHFQVLGLVGTSPDAPPSSIEARFSLRGSLGRRGIRMRI